MIKLTSAEKRVKEFYDQNGISLFKPSWPDFMGYDRKTKEVLFVEAKSVGDRLSESQDESFQILVRMGCKVEVAIVTVMGEIERVHFSGGRERVRIPRSKRLTVKRGKSKKIITQEDIQRRQEEMMHYLEKKGMECGGWEGFFPCNSHAKIYL